MLPEWVDESEYSFVPWLVRPRFIPPPPVVNPPPTRQPSQRFDPPSDFYGNFSPWIPPNRVVPRPALVAAYVPPPHPQLVFWQEPLSREWWQRGTMMKVFRLFNRYSDSQVGACRILNTFGAGKAGGRSGKSRVANLSLQGYTVRVGRNALPDLTLAPAGYGAALPISVPVTPPVSGTDTLYVVVRRRDQYGLESVNQRPLVVRVDSSGNMVLPPLPAPAGLAAYQRPNGSLQVSAGYPGYADPYPADHYQFWINTVPPNVGVDTPTLLNPLAGGSSINFTVGSLIGGVTYYLALCLFRSADGAQSPPATLTFPYLSAPPTPLPVRGAYVLP